MWLVEAHYSARHKRQLDPGGGGGGGEDGELSSGLRKRLSHACFFVTKTTHY